MSEKTDQDILVALYDAAIAQAWNPESPAYHAAIERGRRIKEEREPKLMSTRERTERILSLLNQRGMAAYLGAVRDEVTADRASVRAVLLHRVRAIRDSGALVATDVDSAIYAVLGGDVA